MKKVNKTVYICGFCTHEEDEKSEIILHEKHCMSNPKNKTCHTCIHSNLEDSFGGYCYKLQRYLTGILPLGSEIDKPLSCEYWRERKV